MRWLLPSKNGIRYNGSLYQLCMVEIDKGPFGSILQLVSSLRVRFSFSQKQLRNGRGRFINK